MPHAYLSTACYHLKHEECRVTCKYCPEQCMCRCHWPGEDDTKDLAKPPVEAPKKRKR